MFQRLSETGGAGAPLVRLGRSLDARVMLRATPDGEDGGTRNTAPEDTLLVIRDGAVSEVRPGPHVMPSVDFMLVAPKAEWARFLQPTPPPGSHDLMALLRRGAIRFEGDLHKLMANLMYFKKLLASLRPTNRALKTEAR